MAGISLSEFENTLDPAILDAGRELYQNKALSQITQEDETFWSAEFHLEQAPHGVALEIKRNRVIFAECTCVDFDEDHWQEVPCAHITALIFAAQDALAAQKAVKREKASPGDKKTAAAKGKKIPARKQDPAEALLGELDPKEIFNFVQQMIAKDKSFKSQFLLFFSEKSGTGEQQFTDIVANAIAAVKGRRKHLKGADGAKIASVLTPLYKQAANGEAKGFFREAFQICRTFLQQLPAIFSAMETASSKLETLFLNTLELVSLIIKNPGTPFEFRDEVFAALLQEFKEIEKSYAGSIQDLVYQRLLESARVTKRLEELAAALETIIERYAAMGKKSRWSEAFYAEIKAIDRLSDLLENDIKDPGRVLHLLEKHKNHLTFYLKLIALKTSTGEYDTAIGYVDDIKKNIRKYQYDWTIRDLENRLNTLLLDIHQKQGDQVAIARVDGRLFAESHYLDFQYYELEKSVTTPPAWEKRVSHYLKETRPGQFRNTGMANSFFEILTREARWAQLRDELSEVSSLNVWSQYGDPVRERYPDVYLTTLQKNIEIELRNAYSYQYTLIAQLLQTMAKMENGAPVVRDMAAKFRQKYANRRELIRVLDRMQIQ